MSRPSRNADSSDSPAAGGAERSAKGRRAGLSLRAESGQSAHRALPAVVSSLGRGQQRRRALRSSLVASVPAFLLAALAHAALIWLVLTYLVPVLVPPKAEHTLVASTDFTEDLLTEELEPLPPELEEPELPDVPLPELLVPDESPDADNRPISESLDVLGAGFAGVSGHGFRSQGGGSWGLPEVMVEAGVPDSPFRGFVEDLRARGLDVVFVVDATGSMQRFIERAREAIDDIIGDLAVVVPSLRIGLVAYRDTGDDWTTRRTDLSADRYHIHNFLLDLRAAGGRRVRPDFEEAVEVGLEVAANESSWRDGARRVLLLVGDAPYHEEDKAAALATVRSFSRGEHSLVNTLYVGRGNGGKPTENQTRAREAWDKLANVGGGVSFVLPTEDEGDHAGLRRHVSEATFGPRWAEDIAALQRNAPQDNRVSSVQRRLDRKDRKWFIRRMESVPLHPAVPEGCIDLFDGRIAAAMLHQLKDETLPEPTRSAALYVLKKSIEMLRGMPLDVYTPLADQTDVLAAVRYQVRQVSGADRFLDGAGQQTGVSVPPPSGQEVPPTPVGTDDVPPPPPPVGG